ncbi:hypothetical protein GN958_ATG14722, partial [Phytophthora infestans]
PGLVIMDLFVWKRNVAADVDSAPFIAKTNYIGEHRHERQGRAFDATPLVGGAKAASYTAPVSPDLVIADICVWKRDVAADVDSAPFVAKTNHIGEHRHERQGRAFDATPLVSGAKAEYSTAPVDPVLVTVNSFV